MMLGWLANHMVFLTIFYFRKKACISVLFFVEDMEYNVVTAFIILYCILKFKTVDLKSFHHKKKMWVYEVIDVN